MKKVLAIIVASLLIMSVLGGCAGGGAFKDGTYEGQSSPDERGNYSKVNITVKDGKIASADFKGYLKDGKVKDESYGKGNDENYKKAQDALKSAATYGSKLVEKQDVTKVDAVSGATASHKQFVDAVNKALEKAKK